MADHGGRVRTSPMAVTRSVSSRRLRRSVGDRVLFGVAGGIGERLGVDPLVVRLGFVLLTLAGGVGAICYLASIVASVEPAEGEPPSDRAASGRRTIAVVFVLAGSLLLLRTAGLWLGDDVVVPAALAVFGSIVLWTRATLGRSRLARLLSRSSTGTVRFMAGAALIAVGVVVFVVVGRRSGLLWNGPAAAAAALLVVGVVIGPWMTRLARDVRIERRDRIRSEERATLAAHLHDSVLQTLALIQRADDPRRMASLARTQERELRGWLYGRAPSAGPSMLASAIESVVDQAEREYGVPVESVVVGDAPIDAAAGALVAAAREALVNAARHSGERSVSLFIEVEPEKITAFIRDQGVGFQRAAVALDRRGIADSIEGRIERSGGEVSISSTEGSGTEVRLMVPRAAS
jgi:signal transduction histidine kinase/phage shock protein PspC (stress-responsive transcriptional regulator)